MIGVKNADVTVKVTKKWEGEKLHPDEVFVDLYRVGKNGKERVKLDSGVALNEKNKWTAEFYKLPSKYIDGEGNVQECTYEVEEQPVEGWGCNSEITFDPEKKLYEITLTNSEEKKTGGLIVLKTISGSGASADQKFTFTVKLEDTSVNEIGRAHV